MNETIFSHNYIKQKSNIVNDHVAFIFCEFVLIQQRCFRIVQDIECGFLGSRLRIGA